MSKKNIIRLTESELKNIIVESVKKIIKEDDFDNKEYGFSTSSGGWEGSPTYKPTPEWKKRDYDKLNDYIDSIQKQEKEQARDLDSEIMDIQLQHSQGKKPSISQRAKDFFKQEKEARNKLKQSEPALNKFQQRHKDNVQRKEREEYEQRRAIEWQEEVENAMYILKTITDDEIEYSALSCIFENDEPMYTDWIKIIKKKINKYRDSLPDLEYQVLIAVPNGDVINYDTYYYEDSCSVQTLEDYDYKFDREYYEENPKSRQYLVSNHISAEDIENTREWSRKMAQAAWDEEDYMYGHDNFDNI